MNLYQYAPNALGWVDPLGWVCWSTARRRYWKAEAKSAPKGTYSKVNLRRMRLGLAPRIKVEVYNHKTRNVEIKTVSMELHHSRWPQGKNHPNFIDKGKHINMPVNLTKVTPWEHASQDPFRHVGSTLQKIIQGVNNYGG